MVILLLGMGNAILSDDAIGIRLARDFKARLKPAAEIPNLSIIEECSVGGISLLALMENYDRIVILDSIKTQGGTPGDWYYFTAGSLRETMHLSNIHDANFATALELGRRLGHKIPPDHEIHIFAVEVKDNATFSERMTPPLESAYPVISNEIFKEVLRLIQA